MPINFLLFGGGGDSGAFLEGGGGKVPILFLCAWGFFRETDASNRSCELRDL